MLSIFQWFGYRELGAAESFRLIRQAGFDAVLLWWDDEPDPDYRKQPELARREGLFVENIHAPLADSSHIWEDTAAGQAFFELLLRCVDDCAAFEIPTMVVHPSFGINRIDEMPPASALGLERFARIVSRAEQKNINVAMENLLNPGPNALAAQILEQIDSPRLGLCFDSGHYNACKDKSPEFDLFARFGKRLMALHLHDNDGSGDQHRLPFEGIIDWPALMKQIAQTGYAGPTTLELGVYAELGPEEYLAIAYERAKQLKELRT